MTTGIKNMIAGNNAGALEIAPAMEAAQTAADMACPGDHPAKDWCEE